MGDTTRKTVMVTGAGGFLGKNLIAELVSRNHTVYAVTSKNEEELGVNGLSAVVPNRDFKAIARLLDETDVLVNCAFPRNVDGYKLAEGMDYLQELFAVAGNSQVGAVVNISSQSVYSQTRTEPAREDTPVCLESTYAVAKYASEQLLEAYCSDKPHTNIRLASLIGPGFDQRVVNKMVKKALAGEELLVMENASHFAYLDVADAVSGLLALCNSEPGKWVHAYNLGPDGCVTLTEIANLVLREVNASNGEASGACVKTSENAPTSSELDSSLFENSFNWEACNSLSETIKRIAHFTNDGVLE